MQLISFLSMLAFLPLTTIGLRCNVIAKVPFYDTNETNMNQECKTVVSRLPILPMDQNAKQCYAVKCDRDMGLIHIKAFGTACGTCELVYKTIEKESMGLIKREDCPCMECESDACNVEALLNKLHPNRGEMRRKRADTAKSTTTKKNPPMTTTKCVTNKFNPNESMANTQPTSAKSIDKSSAGHNNNGMPIYLLGLLGIVVVLVAHYAHI